MALDSMPVVEQALLVPVVGREHDAIAAVSCTSSSRPLLRISVASCPWFRDG